MADFPNAPREEFPPPEVAAEAGSPPVLVPVTAEDESRRKSRIVRACLIAGLIVAGIGGWMYRRTMDPMLAQESYASGVHLFTIARYQQAILSFDRAIKLKPDFADAYFMRGRAFVAEAKSERAVADFTRVVELRPLDSQAFVDRATAYLDMKDFQSAIEDANAAIQLNPNLASGYNLRGIAVRAVGEPRKAIEDFDRAVHLAPVAYNYYDRGETFQMLGEHRRAIEDFDRVIAFRPSSPEAYFSRAQARRDLGDFPGAQQDDLRGRLLEGR
jgi:tetratricopeptide (TPR) repeat protein